MALEDKTKQDMESNLEHAVRVVQARFAQLEQNVFIPYLESSRRFAEGYPITATFISIFSLLSFLPVASFFGFAILVAGTFGFIALACAFVASTALIIAAGGILALILSTLFLASILLTIGIVSLFITVRLGQHLRSQNDVKQGVIGWAHETRGRLRWYAPEPSRDVTEATVKKESSGPSGSDEWQAVNDGHS